MLDIAHRETVSSELLEKWYLVATGASLRFSLYYDFISVRESWQSLFVASVAFFTQTLNKQLGAEREGDHFQYLFPKNETHLLPDWKAPIRLLLLFIVSVCLGREQASQALQEKTNPPLQKKKNTYIYNK